MKELEKTKRISVAAVLFILVIIVALLTYKKPKHLYSESADAALQKINSSEFLITKGELTDDVYLIDIRSNFDYNKGFIENAVNISLSDILIDENVDKIKDAVNADKTIVFYGNNPNEALPAHTIIEQLGYANSKILSVSISYFQDKIIVKDVSIENEPEDIQAFIDKSIENAKVEKVEPKPVLKKVIPVKKKKKAPVEGGC